MDPKQQQIQSSAGSAKGVSPAGDAPSPAVKNQAQSNNNDFINLGLSENQFKRLQKTLIYGSVIMGLIASGKRPTVSKANMQEAAGYAEGILALIEGGK